MTRDDVVGALCWNLMGLAGGFGIAMGWGLGAGVFAVTLLLLLAGILVGIDRIANKQGSGKDGDD